MFATTAGARRRGIVAVSAVSGLILLAGWGRALQTTDAKRQEGSVPTAHNGHAANMPSAEQPPAKITADPPKPEPLARGVAIIQFRTENLQIVPVFGPAAATVSPRIGHLHVTFDDAPWHWVHTSNDPLIVAPLPPGPHNVRIELADANHKVLAKEVVKFEVPAPPVGAAPAKQMLKGSADAEFLTKVVPSVAASVKVIEYAANNASDDKVREFAEHVAKQHKESVEIATAHAERLNIAVTSDPGKDSKITVDRLSKLKGTNLDAAFLEWLSVIHADATVFENEVKNGTDADLKTYAKNSIIAGNEHLKEARELLSKLKK